MAVMESPEVYSFSALVSRMKYITRWGLMRSGRAETLSEHTAEAAMLAHILALIARDICGDASIRPETVAVAALYHDASEILTGDMPTPVKYKTEALKTAYKAVEKESAEALATLLPAELQGTLRPYLTGELLSPAERTLLKAADILSALIKCIEEENGGNREFSSAHKQQEAKLAGMNCPAADYFIAHFLPCYEHTLDELTR